MNAKAFRIMVLARMLRNVAQAVMDECRCCSRNGRSCGQCEELNALTITLDELTCRQPLELLDIDTAQVETDCERVIATAASRGVAIV